MGAVESLGHLLQRRAQEDGDREVVVALGESGRRAVSYASLFEDASRLAGSLRDTHGLVHGDRIALLLTNADACEFFTALAAAYIGGFAGVPINARLAPPEIAYQVAHSGARAIVTTGAFAEVVAQIAPETPELGLVLDVSADGDWPLESVGFAQAIAAGAPAEPAASLEDMSALLYTSGTTGLPKGAYFCHRACLEHGRVWSESLGYRPGASIMLASPVYTSTGTHSFWLPTIWRGMTVVFEETFVPELWSRRVRDEQPTFYLGVPAMYSLILRALAKEEGEPPCPPGLIYGGASMPEPLAAQLIETFPAADLWNVYGLTESGPTGTALRPADALRKLGSVGQPLVDCGIRILDTDGNDVAPGADGEIAILAPSRMDGYLGNPEATARTVDPDGWLLSGDIGRLDEEGYLYLLDRKNDVVNRGGFNIYPAEVESALLTHPAVAEVAVVGVPHPVLGEDVAAFVVLAENAAAEPADLTEHCRGRIADYKRPRDVRFVQELPRNAMGKVLRRELRSRS